MRLLITGRENKYMQGLLGAVEFVAKIPIAGSTSWALIFILRPESELKGLLPSFGVPHTLRSGALGSYVLSEESP